MRQVGTRCLREVTPEQRGQGHQVRPGVRQVSPAGPRVVIGTESGSALAPNPDPPVAHPLRSALMPAVGGKMWTVDNFARIRQLHRDGLSARQIARQLGVGRDTVCKSLNHPEPKPYTLSVPRPAPVFGAVPGHRRCHPGGRRINAQLEVTQRRSSGIDPPRLAGVGHRFTRHLPSPRRPARCRPASSPAAGCSRPGC